MTVSPRLDLRVSQSLVMTPQLQQAIKLLQLSSQELVAYVEASIVENPLLDFESNTPDNDFDQALSDDTFADVDALSLAKAAQEEMPLDTDYDNTWNNAQESLHWEEGSKTFTGDMPDFENMASEHVSLKEHLLQQLGLSVDDLRQRFIGAAMIEALHETGYLLTPLVDIAAMIGCTQAEAEALLPTLQSFDPAGVFARDLRECLMLQLKDKHHYDPAVAVVLDNLPALAAQDYQRLKKLCGLNDEDFSTMIAEIRRLDPKPGLNFAVNNAETLIPDLFIRRDKQGQFVAELNADALPKVLVNNGFYTALQQQTKDKGQKEYLTHCYQQANWLVKAMQQRAETILKVGNAIVDRQHDFFEHGIQYLKPMVLKDIALDIGMHESTVSRVTNSKYMATARGVFELKYFFTSGINGVAGEVLSAKSVQFAIRNLIDNERKDNILSDDDIASLLAKQGMNAARRTVAKYREAMGIASSSKRRRMKNL